MDDYRVPVVLASGVLLVIGGVLARTGVWRTWHMWRANPDIPFMVRNAWAAALPAGLTFIAAGVAGSSLPISRSTIVVGTVAMLVALCGLAVTVLIAWRPPDWVKPDWLRRTGTRATCRNRHHFDVRPCRPRVSTFRVDRLGRLVHPHALDGLRSIRSRWDGLSDLVACGSKR